MSTFNAAIGQHRGKLSIYKKRYESLSKLIRSRDEWKDKAVQRSYEIREHRKSRNAILNK